jgi:hypothetical protein
MRKPIALLGVLAFAVMSTVLAQAAAAPASAEPPDRWPKTAQLDGATYKIYTPQFDSWDNHSVGAHAAVSVLAPGTQNPVFGAITITSRTNVDRTARTVYFTDTTIRSVSFPTATNAAARYQQAFQSLFVKGPFTVSLDRVEAALALVGVDKRAQAVPVQNPVPQFVFSANPAVLVTIDGDPAWRPVAGTPYQRVINTRPLLLRDAAGTVYFHLFDGFLQAPGITGPWTVVAKVPSGLSDVATKLAKAGVVDLMEKPPAPKEAPAPPKTGKKAPKTPAAPAVIVATRPTELVVTDGAPDWIGIDGTQLLYVKNTDANVFTDMTNRQSYILVSGRWFTGPGLNGPWQYVAGKDLPATFAQMPDDSPTENVKASIPGTPQSKEALIASLIPQTATVDRAKATFTVQIAGAPEIKPVAGAQLNYVVNAPTPLVQMPNGPWFALQKGVWFTATKLSGPWAVATTVPAAIYTIPVSSPLYYATYVQIYDTTPTTVTVGYLPGYMGTYATADGTLVYGTGYAYAPYLGSAVWYGAPVTYGYAAGLAWTPWTGWGIGFGMGWGYGAAWGLGAWGWGCAPYWGAYGGAGAWGVNGAYGAWGPQGWAATSGNVYHQWGNTSAVTRTAAGYNAWTGNAWSGQVGHSYNSQTGQISAGQRGTVGNVYTGNYASGARGATTNPKTGVSASAARGTVGNAYAAQSTDVGRASVSGPGGNDLKTATVGDNHYADANGTVYRNTGSGWQQHDSSGGWSSAGADSTRSMESQQQARSWGDTRSSASSWGGGERSYGGGFRGSGGGFEGGGFRGGDGRR